MIARPIVLHLPEPLAEVISCSRCAATIVPDPEDYNWRVHEAWHDNLDEVLDNLATRA